MDKLDFILARQTLMMEVLITIAPKNPRVRNIMDEWGLLAEAFKEADENGKNDGAK